MNPEDTYSIVTFSDLARNSGKLKLAQRLRAGERFAVIQASEIIGIIIPPPESVTIRPMRDNPGDG